jgi:hypothetical protein
MNQKLALWVPALLSMVFGIALVKRFIENQYPLFGQSIHALSNGKSPSPLNAQQVRILGDLKTAWASDSVPPQTPFRNAMVGRNTNPSNSLAPHLPWVRPVWILKGTVADQAATLVNNAGRKTIVRVGDFLDSVEVVAIQSGRITLRDTHGIFEITAQP